MDSNKALAPLVVVIAMLFGVYATMSILLSGGNTVGEFARYVLVGGFFICLLQPRLGFFLWLFACGYNDLLKRFLVIGGRISWGDLPYVLGIAPMMFGGVLLSLLLGGILGSRPLKDTEWKMFMGGATLMAFSAVSTYFSDGRSLGSVLQALANDGLYSMLLFVIPVLFKTADDLLHVVRCLIWIFVPVALYGIAQKINGFQDFEIAYLRTGMSIEIKQLFTNRIRAFSTLNSPTSLATVSAALCGLSLLMTSRAGSGRQERLMNPLLGLLLAGIFFGSWLASTGRAPIIVVPFAIIGTWAFQQRRRTVTLYATVAIAFVLLVLTSHSILDNLEEMNQSIGEHASKTGMGGDMLAVGSYSDRLIGFSTVLANPKAWSLFGLGAASSQFYCHDPLSPLLLKFGVVGFLLFIGGGVFVLKSVHARLHVMHQPHLRWLASLFQSLSMGFILTALLSGSILTVFPINVFFWFFWGAVALLTAEDAAMAEAEPVETEVIAQPTPPTPRRRRPMLIKSIPPAI